MRSAVAPSDDSPLPIAAIVSVQFRPIMSMFRFATVFSSGKSGCSPYHSEPSIPFSSPLTVMNTTDRLGRGPVAKACASSMTPAVPEASSSAPL